MGGDQEHTITVDEDGDVCIDGGEALMSDYTGDDFVVLRPYDMSDDEARAILTAPRMRPLPDGAPEDAMPSKWSDDGVICMVGDAPEGWDVRHVVAAPWKSPGWYADRCTLVEARPPQPPATERVPWWECEGMKVRAPNGITIRVDELRVMNRKPQGRGEGFTLWSDLPLDADGMVEVIAP